jgi:hypothetical protein
VDALVSKISKLLSSAYVVNSFLLTFQLSIGSSDLLAHKTIKQPGGASFIHKEIKNNSFRNKL